MGLNLSVGVAATEKQPGPTTLHVQPRYRPGNYTPHRTTRTTQQIYSLTDTDPGLHAVLPEPHRS